MVILGLTRTLIAALDEASKRRRKRKKAEESLSLERRVANSLLYPVAQEREGVQRMMLV